MRQNPAKTFSLGLQHVLAMYAGAVIVPLIVGGALGMSTEDLTYLVAIDMLTSGIATLLQVWRNRFFGIGLPVVLGCTFTAVTPMIAIGGDKGIAYIYGAIIASGIFVLLFAGLFGKLIRFFPPVVTGSVVTIIGISLIPVAANNFGGGQGAPDFGDPVNLILGAGVLVLILLLNRIFTGFTRAISILIGLVAGTAAAAFFGKVNFQAVVEADLIRIPQPFYFGVPAFDVTAILTMILVAIVSVVESTGVFFALGKICDRDLNSSDLTRGYRAEGLAAIVGGVFNSFPYTTFSQNVGLVQMSGVKSRNVIVVAGGLLVVLGLLPKFAALATLIPNPVLGGAMVAMFGMVVSSGIQMLGSRVDLNRQENLLIIACSVGIGMGVTVVPGLFSQLPQVLRVITDSGIVAGGLTAVLLNILFNAGKAPSEKAEA